MKKMLNAGLSLAGLGALVCAVCTAIVLVVALGARGNAAGVLALLAILGGLVVVVGLQLASMAYSKHRLDQIHRELIELRERSPGC